MSDDILNDISHRRYNPLTGAWLLVSPHRTKRPWQGQQEAPSRNTLPEYDPKCYLCPGNTRAQGDVNPPYDSTFVFVNDYSAVKEEQAAYEPAAETEGEDERGGDDEAALAARLLRAEAATGRCYVLTFSPKHHLTLADMAPEAIEPVIQTWTRLYATHLAADNPVSAAGQEFLRAHPVATDDAAAAAAAAAATPMLLPPPPAAQLRYMQIFENKGAAMGCSNPHPHCQIWATSSLPQEPEKELAHMRQYRADHAGRHLLGDYVALERRQHARIVFENDSFLVVCPWWAVWPFEVLVLARRHVRALVDLTDAERRHLAAALHEVARRYDNLFETSFPYSAGIHQAPLACASPDEADDSWFHMHFYPPLLRSATVKKFLVGYELLAEPQRDITPEQAAERLRACGGPLYRTAL